MDLRSFVTETLVQIVDGVSEAKKQIEAGASNARINPDEVYPHQQKKSGRASAVEFDVALTVAEETMDAEKEKVGARAGLLSVVSLGASAEINGERSGSAKNETVSRVRFTVMLAQPSDLTEKRGISVPTTASPWG